MSTSRQRQPVLAQDLRLVVTGILLDPPLADIHETAPTLLVLCTHPPALPGHLEGVSQSWFMKRDVVGAGFGAEVPVQLWCQPHPLAPPGIMKVEAREL